MKKQLLIAIAVFTVGFGVGYGITWLLVSGGTPTDGGARAEVKNGLASSKAGGEAKAPSVVKPPAATVKAPVAPAVRPKPAKAPVDTGDDKIGSAPVARPGQAKPPVAKPATPAAASPDAGATKTADAGTAAAAVPAPVVAKPAAPSTWWDRCVGKKCAVDWGLVRGGISIRKGTLKHNARVDWKLRFGGADRIDSVKTTEKLVFEVHGVGLGMDGLPTCAQVEYKRRGKTIVGIIALKLGAKRITMVPVP